jgi:hypothetical protein
MTVAPQVAMQKASQMWQVFFPLQTLHVFFFSFAKPSDFWFGPSQKGTICNSVYKTNHKFCKETIHEMGFDFMGPIKPVEIYTGNKYFL